MSISLFFYDLKLRLMAHKRWHFERPLLRLLVRPRPRADLAPAGGLGWFLPTSMLNSSSVCYCGGVGEDIRLELELANRFGCEVYAFDPTPGAAAFIEKQRPLPAKFHFVPEGLWSGDSELTFFAPADGVDFSLVVNCGRGRTLTAKCSSIKSLMKRFGHQRLDLLKMNIEGAEYEVMRQMLKDGIKPRILAVAFEGTHSFWRVFQWRKILQREGYTFIQLVNYTALYILED